MTGSAKRDLALYLLSKMDAADRIQQALAALGASGAEMKAASSRVEAVGLMDLVRTIDRFERALGPAEETSPLADGGRRYCYRLGPWPLLWLAVDCDPQSVVSGLCFVRPPNGPPPRLEPWECLDPEAGAFGSVRAVIDEWHPYKSLLLERQAALTLLRFEYGLLQSADDVDAAAAAALERDGWAPRR